MKSIAIDPHGNTFIRENGRIQYTRTNLEYLQQKIRCALSLFLGEWYLDTRLGIPYIPKTDNKTGHRAVLESAIQTRITAVRGVRRLLYFTPSHDPHKRTFTVQFAVETEGGETLEREETWNTV